MYYFKEMKNFANLLKMFSRLSFKRKSLLKFVNSAVNVSSNMIGYFEIMPLSSVPTVILIRPTKGSPSFFFFQA